MMESNRNILFVSSEKIYEKAIKAVSPCEMIHKSVQLINEKIVINEQCFPLNGKVVVLAFGKAVFEMAQAVEDILGDYLEGGIASVPVGTVSQSKFNCCKKIQVIEGALNNIPDKSSLEAASVMYSVACSLKEDDIALILISGGGSALLPLPISPVTLDQLVHLTTLLSRKGASISELNIVRKQLELLKGGGLARAVFPARVIALILSDVIGDPLDIIASGPTTLDSSSVEDAFSVICKYNIQMAIPDSVKNALAFHSKAKQIANCNVSDDTIFANVSNIIIGSNYVALKAAELCAQEFGFQVHLLTSTLTGDVQILGLFYFKLIYIIIKLAANQSIDSESFSVLSEQFGNMPQSQLQSLCHLSAEALKARKTVCLLAGGEPTISVTGHGKGGRCQELCLYIAKHLNGLSACDSFNIGVFCAGTDGQDGPTDAAGAFVNNHTYTEAASQGLDINDYLRNNDSYSFFSKVNNGYNLIKPGLTGTNVMDIHVILIKPNVNI